MYWIHEDEQNTSQRGRNLENLPVKAAHIGDVGKHPNRISKFEEREDAHIWNGEVHSFYQLERYKAKEKEHTLERH